MRRRSRRGAPATLKRGRLAHRGRRGVGFLWFCLVALPALMFSAGMSVDVTRIIAANREVGGVAEAVAVAGAHQFHPTKAELADPGTVRGTGMSLWTFAQESGVLAMADDPRVDISSTTTEVTVVVDYNVTGLVFLSWFQDGTKKLPYRVIRTAEVCIPGVTTGTGGFCTRPLPA